MWAWVSAKFRRALPKAESEAATGLSFTPPIRAMLKLALLVLAVALAVQACSPVLSCSQMQAVVKANFPSQYQTDMLCIAYYESSYCPGVYNGTLRLPPTVETRFRHTPSANS